MKKHLLRTLTMLAVCLLLTTLAISASAADFAGGSGTASDPYLIRTKAQLNNVRKYLSAHFKMTADIIFTDSDFVEGGTFYNGGAGWVSIGNSSTKFTGSFDGDGHTITGLMQKISATKTTYGGLFGYVSGGVKNLGMVDAKISVNTSSYYSAYAGSIAGYTTGTISECYSTGVVKASSLSTSSSYSAYAGGIVGYLHGGTVSNCYSSGEVTAASTSYSDAYAGGITGYVYGNSSTITDSYNTGAVTASASSLAEAYAGGIVGYLSSDNSIISECYNMGMVSSSSTGAHAGGIVGYVRYSTISNCYNAGKVEASSTSSWAYAGGIMGYASSSTISNCYNTGPVSTSSTRAYTGGIAGCVSGGDVRNCYNMEAVSGDTAGGIVGRLFSGTINNCYYCDVCSKGVGDLSTDTTTKCTADQMKQKETFASFDFDAVWTMGGNEDYFYPELISVPMNYTKKVESIAIAELPEKLEYFDGEPLDATGGKIAVYYDNGTNEIIALTAEILSGFDASVLGKQTLTVTHGGKTTTFEVVAKTRCFAGGLGTEEEPFLIGNKEQLNSVRKYLSYHYKMTADVEFTAADFVLGGEFYNDGAGWVSIGSSSTEFTGSFDGDGHTIMGLRQNISDGSTVYGGLFGYVNGATIENLGMVGSDISISTTARRAVFAGGIVGYGSSSITNCYNTGSVRATSSSSVHAGGIVGYASGSATISECYNTGMATALCTTTSSTYYARAGGIAGYASGTTISNCYNTGAVSATPSSSARAGGIAGYASSSTINNCYYLNTCSAGIGNKSEGSVKCTVAEMKEQETFDGFDFTNVWTMSGHEEYLYPKLQAIPMVFEAKLSGIAVTTLPNKTTYIEGTAFDSTGLVVAEYYTGGRTVPVTPDSVSGYTATVGTNTITVTYGDYTDTFEVEVVAKSVTSIEVTAPVKLSYLEAKDALDVAGGKVTVYYNNDTSEVIDLTASMVYDFDNTVVGEQTLTVYYKGYTDAFDVTIVAKSMTDIEVTAPFKTSYLEAKDALDVAGGKVVLYYNNGTNEEIEVTANMISGFDNTVVGKQTLTVTYEGFTDTFEIEIVAKSKSSIEVTAPTKVAYLEAKEKLAVTGGIVTLRYNNDTSEEIALTADMVSGFDNTVVGKQTLTVTYEGFTDTFEVEIVAKSVTAIGVIPPTKLTYIEAKETFDPAGGSVFVFYNNGTSEMIDLSAGMVSGFDNTVVGEQTLTVSYGGFTDSFKVEVLAKSAIFVALTTEPTKLTYFEGEALDVSGGKVSVSYNNGTGETIDLTAEMVSGFDSTVVGKQTLTVSYGGKTDTFEVEVVAKSATSISISSVSTTSATLTFANNEAGTCYVGFYSNEGKMLSYGLATVTANAGEVTVTIMPFTTTSQYTVKAFLVDTQGIPICDCAIR